MARLAAASTLAVALLTSVAGSADEGGHARVDRFLLPAFERVEAIRCTVHLENGKPPEAWKGRMEVDGLLTDAPWPEQPPTAYRLPGGRYLLHDRYSGRGAVYLWEPDGRRLTSLGAAQLVPIAGWGQVVLSGDPSTKTVRICDVDPRRPALRTLWSAQETEVRIAGHSGGAIFATIRGKQDSCALLTLEPGRRPVTQFIELAHFQPASTDSVRGRRMLLLSPGPGRLWVVADGKTPLPEADVAILDLDFGTLRVLGKIKACCDASMNLPHYYFSVGWITKRPDPRPALPRGLGLGESRGVLEETGELLDQ